MRLSEPKEYNMKKLIGSFLFTAVLYMFIVNQAVPESPKFETKLNTEISITDDFYMIKNAADDDIVGYSKGSFDIRKSNRQFFHISKVGDSYRIRNMANEALTAQWDGSIDHVILWPDVSAPNQLWKINKTPNGFSIQYGPSGQFVAEEDGKMILSNIPSEFLLIERVPYLDKPFKYYSMADSAWAYRKYSYKTMSAAGCGPASLAMIINYYSKETVTPLTVADISVANNLDIMASPRTDMPKLAPMIAETFGVNYKVISRSDVVPELKNGNTVLLGTLTNKAINYTLGQGHFLVLRGLDRNGWIIVNDPLAAHSYHTKADSSVENYSYSFNYVAPADAVLAKGTEYYSFWSK